MIVIMLIKGIEKRIDCGFGSGHFGQLLLHNARELCQFSWCPF